jgi:hypothetical protein
MYVDGNVAKKMSEANQLGLHPDEYSVGELEEIEKVHEVYNSEESRLIDQMADAMLYLIALGDKSEASSTEAKDFACLINDLTDAKTEAEYDETLSCYGNLGQNPAVKEYVEYKKAQLSA